MGLTSNKAIIERRRDAISVDSHARTTQLAIQNSGPCEPRRYIDYSRTCAVTLLATAAGRRHPRKSTLGRYLAIRCIVVCAGVWTQRVDAAPVRRINPL